MSLSHVVLSREIHLQLEAPHIWCLGAGSQWDTSVLFHVAKFSFLVPSHISSTQQSCVASGCHIGQRCRVFPSQQKFLLESTALGPFLQEVSLQQDSLDFFSWSLASDWQQSYKDSIVALDIPVTTLTF